MASLYLISNGSPLPMQLYLGQYLSLEKSFNTIEGVRVGSPHSWPFPSWAKVNNRHKIEYKDQRLKVLNKIRYSFNLFRNLRRFSAEHLLCSTPIENIIICSLYKRVKPSIRFDIFFADTKSWMYSKLGKRILSYFMRNASSIYFTSKGFQANLLDLIEIGNTELIYSPNIPYVEGGINIENKIVDNQLKLGWIGSIRGDLGVRTMIEASSFTNVISIFAGSGHLAHEVVSASASSNDIRYLGPFENSELAKLYSKINVVFAIYDKSQDKKFHEPCRLFEAILFHKPILVMKNTHLATIVEALKIGEVIDVEDDQDIQDKLHLIKEKINTRQYDLAFNKARNLALIQSYF